jgi:hypothetical protein
MHACMWCGEQALYVAVTDPSNLYDNPTVDLVPHSPAQVRRPTPFPLLLCSPVPAELCLVFPPPPQNVMLL